MAKPFTRRDALTLAASLSIAAPAVAAPYAGAAIAPALLRRGINTWPWFSLTREYPAPRRNYAWPPYQEGRAIPKPRDLARLAAAGFDFIRLPVDPGPFLAASPNDRAKLMSALSNAVREAQNAGLGVIVNIQTNDATHYWNAANLVSSVDAPEFPAYRALVAATAQALAQLDRGRLALEPVNEPPQDCHSGAWSKVQDMLLESARTAAPRLTLIATGACGSMVRGLDALDPAPLARFAPLLFTFHFYEPYLFTHQGAPWMREPVYRDLTNVPWPASTGTLDATLSAVRAQMARDTGRSAAEKREAYAMTERLMAQYFEGNPSRPFIDSYLGAVTAWGERNGIARDQILMGEFGAVKTTFRFTGAAPDSRMRYIRDTRQSAEAHGFGWAFWNLFDSMGIMDDQSHEIDPGAIAALGLVPPP